MTSRKYNMLMIGASLAGWIVGMGIGILIIKACT